MAQATPSSVVCTDPNLSKTSWGASAIEPPKLLHVFCPTSHMLSLPHFVRKPTRQMPHFISNFIRTSTPTETWQHQNIGIYGAIICSPPMSPASVLCGRAPSEPLRPHQALPAARGSDDFTLGATFPRPAGNFSGAAETGSQKKPPETLLRAQCIFLCGGSSHPRGGEGESPSN